jgi:hypothetical protein
MCPNESQKIKTTNSGQFQVQQNDRRQWEFRPVSISTHALQITHSFMSISQDLKGINYAGLFEGPFEQ